MNNKETDYAAIMETKTNEAAQKIIKCIKECDLIPMAAIVSLVKASAILIESYNAVGEDGNELEKIVSQCIGPARMEVRERFMPETDTKKVFNN